MITAEAADSIAVSAIFNDAALPAWVIAAFDAGRLRWRGPLEVSTEACIAYAQVGDTLVRDEAGALHVIASRAAS